MNPHSFTDMKLLLRVGDPEKKFPLHWTGAQQLSASTDSAADPVPLRQRMPISCTTGIIPIMQQFLCFLITACLLDLSLS